MQDAYVEERRSSGRRASRLYLTRHVSRESASPRVASHWILCSREIHKVYISAFLSYSHTRTLRNRRLIIRDIALANRCHRIALSYVALRRCLTSGEFLKVVQFAAGVGSMRFHLSARFGVAEITGPPPHLGSCMDRCRMTLPLDSHDDLPRSIYRAERDERRNRVMFPFRETRSWIPTSDISREIWEGNFNRAHIYFNFCLNLSNANYFIRTLN